MKTKSVLFAVFFALSFSMVTLGAEGYENEQSGEDLVAEYGWFSKGTCEAVPVADISTGGIWCSITKYCGLFRGKTTLTTSPLDYPPCSCECK